MSRMGDYVLAQLEKLDTEMSKAAEEAAETEKEVAKAAMALHKSLQEAEKMAKILDQHKAKKELLDRRMKKIMVQQTRQAL